MTVDSPIFGLLVLPIAVLVVVLAAALTPAGRWLLRAAMLMAVLAVAGVDVRCDRPPRVAVMVDVSPSTRGATFRDPAAVTARLAPLLVGRPYTLHYFADGPLGNAQEPAVARTRLEVPSDADAVVLMSDGRFDRPAALPPTFAVVDPALDGLADARVRDVNADVGGSAEAGGTADVVSAGADRPLAGVGLVAPVGLPGGPAVVPLGPLTPGVIGFAAGDAWPENDSLAVAPAGRPLARWSVGRPLPGFVELAALPADPARYAGVAGVVLSTDAAVGLPADATAAIKAFVEEFGGTLVLAGPPDAVPADLRALSPLSAVPPAGPQTWTILLDCSGSMAAVDAAGVTRWESAIAAAKSAVTRLPDGARVTVLGFARDVRTFADAVPPDAAAAALNAATDAVPSGPTGLRAALESLGADTGRGPNRVLLLGDGDADLGDAAALGRRLAAGGVTLDAVISAPAAAVSIACAAAGGRAEMDAPPAAWSRVLGGVAAKRTAADGAQTLVGRGVLAGRALRAAGRYAASAKRGADVLAAHAAAPVVAAWPAGVGRAIAVAAELSADDLADIAVRLERPVSDPKYAVAFDESAGVVRLTAGDGHGPINALSPVLNRAGERATFVAVAPGTYEAALDRRSDATVAVVSLAGQVVARRCIAGRYPAEFDAVGNDRDELIRVARESGGAVIKAGDNRSLTFQRRSFAWPLTPVLSVIAAMLMLAAVWVVRQV